MSKPIQFLRWLIVPPTAFLCAFLATFPVHWVVALIQIFSRVGDPFITINGKNLLAAIPPETLEKLGNAFFGPLVMITSGASMAPKFKFVTGISFAILWGIIFGAGMTLAITQGQYSGSGWLRFAITCALGIAGVASGVYHVHIAQKDEQDGSDIHKREDKSTELVLDYNQALSIVQEYGRVLAETNDEQLRFKPISRLRASKSTIREALKFVHRTDYPLPEDLENAYGIGYQSLADFIDDDAFIVANCHLRNISRVPVDEDDARTYRRVADISMKERGILFHDWLEHQAEVKAEVAE